MLDLSDHAAAPAPTQSEPTTNLPVIGIPEVGTLVRHFRGSIFRVEGSSAQHDSNDVLVLYRALDPADASTLRACPAASFFAVAVAAQPRFVRLTNSSAEKIRAYLPEDILDHPTLELVLRSYDEPWRFFHTREHIHAMFDLAVRRKIALTTEQALAVLLHDLVYVPGAPEGVNERQSVLLSQTLKSRVQAKLDWDLVGSFIEDTATHTARTSESRVVLDLDLASLGDNQVQFAAANELIWLENRHLLPLPDARKDFDTRRLRFLLALAEKGPMFSNNFSDYESSARDNLEELRRAWVQRYRDR
jgi:predicted metal-dependent HD superfamily phosphohydrolase